MCKVTITLATVVGVVAGFLASSVQAANGCKGHSTYADCSAEKVCNWNVAKNKCKPVKPK
jgi:hypothetical protein